jgi:hypothetical protein
LLGPRLAGRGKKGKLKEVLTELSAPAKNEDKSPRGSSQPPPVRPTQAGEPSVAIGSSAPDDAAAADAPLGPEAVAAPADTPHTATASFSPQPIPGVDDAEMAAADRSRDPMTDEPCFLPPDEASRLAVCFPAPDAATRTEHRLPWGPELPWEAVADALAAAATGGNATMRAFTLANVDQLGDRARLLLTGLKMNAQFRKSPGEMESWRATRSLFLWAEFSLSTPFRQLLREAEGQVGRVVDDDQGVARLAETLPASGLAGVLLLLHAAVATWEGKQGFEQLAIQRLQAELDADQASGGVSSGVDRKHLLDVGEQLVQRTREAERTGANLNMWRRMSQVLSAQPALKATLAPVAPELVFLDGALKLQSATDMRALLLRDVCGPGGAGEAVGEAAVREGARRVLRLATCLNPTNYGERKSHLSQPHQPRCFFLSHARSRVFDLALDCFRSPLPLLPP